MSSEPYDPRYPNEVDLGRPLPSVDGKKGKTKMSYPTLFIDGAPPLPKKGYALIKFTRASITIGKNRGLGLGPADGEEGEDKTSQEIEVHSLCLPADDGGDSSGDVADEFKSFAKKAGVNTGDGPAPEADDEEEDEEKPEGEEEEQA